MKKKGFTNILLIFVFLLGPSLLLYPTVSDYWNSLHQSRVVSQYAEEVANLDNEVYDKIIEEAREYNRAILNRERYFEMSEETVAAYNSALNVSDTGVMGYIEIPKIDCSLAIYHGVEEKVLQIAVGHVDWTSLPIGGESTHAVLSGHRGLPSAKLFTNLDKLEVGDNFIIRVLDETMTYEVDQILIVLPAETEALRIEEGKDLCTLVTCTPYGINTHRLLVRGHRVENEVIAQQIRVTADAIQIDPIIVAPLVAAPMLLVLLIILLVTTRKKKRRSTDV